MTNDKHNTRESWLQAAAQRLVPLIEAHAEGAKMPAYRVSCGWPARSALARKHRRIGECWVQGGKFKEIFITPTLADGVRVADVLAHELCHAILPAGTGHKAPFARLAKAIGLEGKPTATEAGPDLRATLERIVEEEGPYPHGAIAPPTNLPKQNTRMRLVECPSCGAKWRAPRSTIERGVPTCACGMQMVAADDIDMDSREPLKLVEQVTEYVTDDGRLGIRRYVRKGALAKWQLVDFEPADGGAARLAGFFDTEAEVHEAIGLIRDGLWTPAPIEDEAPEDDDEAGHPLDDMDLGDPEQLDRELEELRLLGDDEVETPDYPDDQPEDDAEWDEYLKVSDAREASGRRTSEKIAAGADE